MIICECGTDIEKYIYEEDKESIINHKTGEFIVVTRAKKYLCPKCKNIIKIDINKDIPDFEKILEKKLQS